jgi:hypothetical protein
MSIAVAASLAATAILLTATGFAGALSFVIRAAGTGGSAMTFVNATSFVLRPAPSADTSAEGAPRPP